MTINKKFFIPTFIITFIILYFLFLINVILSPFNYEIPILSMFGFVLFIIGVFYFFINMNKFEDTGISLNFRVVNEDLINFILIILMVIML